MDLLSCNLTSCVIFAKSRSLLVAMLIDPICTLILGGDGSSAAVVLGIFKAIVDDDL